MSIEAPVGTAYTVAQRLLEEGVQPLTIARCLDIPLEHVEQLPAARHYRSIDPEEVAVEVSKTIALVIDEANAIILNGTPAMKLRLIQSILGTAMAQMRNQSPKAMEELRTKLETLTSGIIGDEDDDDDD